MCSLTGLNITSVLVGSVVISVILVTDISLSGLSEKPEKLGL